MSWMKVMYNEETSDSVHSSENEDKDAAVADGESEGDGESENESPADDDTEEAPADDDIEEVPADDDTEEGSEDDQQDISDCAPPMEHNGTDFFPKPLDTIYQKTTISQQNTAAGKME